MDLSCGQLLMDNGASEFYQEGANAVIVELKGWASIVF